MRFLRFSKFLLLTFTAPLLAVAATTMADSPPDTFERDVIEALFLGSGPLSPAGAPACPHLGALAGFPRGTHVTVRVSTTVSVDKRNAIRDALALVPTATGGHITTSFELTGDPNPIPGPNQVTSTTHPQPSTQGCVSDVGCTIHTFSGLGVFVASRAVQPAAQTVQAYVHDVVGHGILGMCHIDGNLIGGAEKSLMSGGQGVFSGDLAHELTALDMAAVSEVYGALLEPGDTRDEFLSQGLVNPSPGSPCVSDGNTLCLRDSRFEVKTTFMTPQGETGLGQASVLTDETGTFWFFSAANVEVIVKVLNGCGVNGRYWVFAGGLTNVDVRLVLRDTAAGALAVYDSPAMTPFEPIPDTGAFATCP